MKFEHREKEDKTQEQTTCNNDNEQMIRLVHNWH